MSPASPTRCGRRAARRRALCRASSSRPTTGEPSPKAHVYVFRSPRPGPALVARRRHRRGEPGRASGSYGLVDAADADVGLALVLDGTSTRRCPPGDYVVVARTQDGMGFSDPADDPGRRRPDGGRRPQVATPAPCSTASSTRRGDPVPAKVALVALDASGKPARGRRPPPRLPRRQRASATASGPRRLDDGRGRDHASSPAATASAPRAGRSTASSSKTSTWRAGGVQHRRRRGPPRGRHHRVDVDRHAPPRDAELRQRHAARQAARHRRRRAGGARGLDRPRLRDRLRAHHPRPASSTRTWPRRSAPRPPTIEQGHFIGFPLQYDATIVPTHGSHDPTCESGGEILDALQQRGADPSSPPFIIVAHPRDGFFGYIYQLGVDPYTMKRKVSLARGQRTPSSRPRAATSTRWRSSTASASTSCARRPSSPIVDYNRCLARVDAAKSQDALEDVCPELAPKGLANGLLAPCTPGEPFTIAVDRNRTALAWAGDEAHPHAHARGAGGDLELHGHARRPDADGRRPAHVRRVAVRGQADAGRRRQSALHVTTPARSTTTSATSSTGWCETQVAEQRQPRRRDRAGLPAHLLPEPDRLARRARTARRDREPARRPRVRELRPVHPRERRRQDASATWRPATRGGKVALDLQVQTASWFGVDRIEVYENGHLVKVLDARQQARGHRRLLGHPHAPRARRSATRGSSSSRWASRIEDLMRPSRSTCPSARSRSPVASRRVLAHPGREHVLHAAAPPAGLRSPSPPTP